MFGVEYKGGGLFRTTEKWIHPSRRESTYEIIYIVKGTVYMREGEKKYELREKNLIILKKEVCHEGYIESSGDTEFYWIHFSSDTAPKIFFVEEFSSSYLFRQLIHYDNYKNCPERMCDIIASYLICEIEVQGNEADNSKKLVKDVFEWVRINATSKLTVKEIAGYFKYNSEHISRLVKKEYKKGLKNIIDDFIVKRANEYLMNTNYSVKEIAALLGFSDSTAFINFYKYHENTTPTKFRNSYSNIHMNKK